ncbi:hypothetical protein PAPHI01_1639 [Pancytospora philotis]|nr:hypothetical protein PAPHI01_1639 [Pancytospora philotis]
MLLLLAYSMITAATAPYSANPAEPKMQYTLSGSLRSDFKWNGPPGFGPAYYARLYAESRARESSAKDHQCMLPPHGSRTSYANRLASGTHNALERALATEPSEWTELLSFLGMRPLVNRSVNTSADVDLSMEHAMVKYAKDSLAQDLARDLYNHLYAHQNTMALPDRNARGLVGLELSIRLYNYISQQESVSHGFTSICIFLWKLIWTDNSCPHSECRTLRESQFLDFFCFIFGVYTDIKSHDELERAFLDGAQLQHRA